MTQAAEIIDVPPARTSYEVVYDGPSGKWNVVEHRMLTFSEHDDHSSAVEQVERLRKARR